MKSGKLYNYLPLSIDGTLQRIAKREPIPKVIYSAAPALGHDGLVQYMGEEGSERVTYTLESLKKAKLTPKFRGSEIIQIENIRTATMEEIQSVHSRSYISSLMQLTTEAKAKGILHFEGTELSPGAPLSYITGKSLDESAVAVGTGLSIVDSVVEAAKQNDMPPIGFALIRPPGSHAVPNAKFPMKFCVFNNLAIAARYAQRVHGLQRVFIIDFDAHHGNGTSDAFYDDPNVFYLSTHQDVAYQHHTHTIKDIGCGNGEGTTLNVALPRIEGYQNVLYLSTDHQDVAYTHHTGKIEDIGCGNGEGTTLNVALPKLTGDVAMLNVFDEVIIPATKKFKPDIILVSAGYNGHVRGDTGSKFQMTTAGYYRLASKIQGLARIVCGGRCVFFLEGGNDEFSLAESVVECFRAFLGDPSKAADYGGDLDYEPSSKVEQVIKRIKHLHSL